MSGTAVAVNLVACGSVACPAVGNISTVRLHITPERARSLSTLGMEFCQDGSCRSASLNGKALATATPGYVSPRPVLAIPLRQADGGVEVAIEIAINDHPLDVMTTGTDTQGWSIGTTHALLHPVSTYPDGKQCGGPTTTSATLDPLGLQAG